MNRDYRGFFEKNKAVMLVIDPETGTIVDANEAAQQYYGYSKKAMTTMKILEINTLSAEEVRQEMALAAREQRNHFYFRHKLSSGELRDVEVFSGPVRYNNRDVLLSIIHDITDRVSMEKERETLIKDLQKALKDIKTLSGLIPICAKCKKIRDDKGYWNSLENYIETHTDGQFSHGLCPECAEELYGGEKWYKEKKGTVSPP